MIVSVYQSTWTLDSFLRLFVSFVTFCSKCIGTKGPKNSEGVSVARVTQKSREFGSGLVLANNHPAYAGRSPALFDLPDSYGAVAPA